MRTLILFPNDYLNPKKVNEDYAQEFDAAQKYGFYTGLIDDDAWVNDNTIKLILPKSFEGEVLYRGWMVKPEQYDELDKALQARHCRLIQDKDVYCRYHTLPGYYHWIKDNTPQALWFKNGDSIDWDLVRNTMSKCIVKDYVKSEKNTSFPKFLDLQMLSDNELNEYIKLFIEMRDDLYTGGIVLKEFVNLKKYGETTNEIRAFFFDEKLLTLTQNSAQPVNCPVVPEEFVKKFAFFGFYSIDFAELEDGSWTIIECGDGQVSGLPERLSVDEFYKNLAKDDVYILKFMHEYASTCLWSVNSKARSKYGYPIDIDEIPVSESLKLAMKAHSKHYETILNWDEPNGQLLWTKSEYIHYIKKADCLLAQLYNELDDEYIIEDWINRSLEGDWASDEL